MHRAFVRLRVSDGTRAQLCPGDVIGRAWSAALPLRDPRVSEAHAMVSMRGGELWLLALRRRIAVDGRSLGEVRLETGLTVGLADGLTLVVEALELPDEVLGIEGDGVPPMALPAVCSLRVRPNLIVSARFEPDAPCRLWTDGDGWWREQAGEVHPLTPGDRWTVDGVAFRAVAIALRVSGGEATRMTGGVDPPLRIVAAWDTAQIHVGENAPIVFAGVHARILSELVTLGGPAAWEVVAGEVWPEEDDVRALRKRWDVALGRLRARLREERVRSDLVCSVGTGQVELVLREGDRVEDRA